MNINRFLVIHLHVIILTLSGFGTRFTIIGYLMFVTCSTMIFCQQTAFVVLRVAFVALRMATVAYSALNSP